MTYAQVRDIIRFAGPDKLVHLIGNGEAPPRRWWGFAERLDGAAQIGQGFGNGNQLAAFTLHVRSHASHSPIRLRQDTSTRICTADSLGELCTSRTLSLRE